MRRPCPCCWRCCSDRDVRLRQAATAGLKEARQLNAVAPLLAALKDDAPDVRLGALFALLQLQDSLPDAPECRGILAAAAGLISDKDAAVRRTVVQALGARQDELGTKTLVQGLADAEASVRIAALDTALIYDQDERVAVAAWPLLKDADVDIRYKALTLFGYSNDPRVPEAAAAALPDGDWRMQHAALYTLAGQHDPRCLELLLPLLQRPETDIRLRAISALASLDASLAGGTRVIDALKLQCRDKEALVRARAFSAFPHKLNDSLMDFCDDAARHDPDPRVRMAALCILRITDGQRDIELALQALNSPDAEVRIQAAGCLDHADDPRVFPPLLAAWHDPDARVRAGARTTLVMLLAGKPLQDPRMIASLRASLSSADAGERRAAAMILGSADGREPSDLSRPGR